ncbi:hypothetical protein Hanom_Chr14g01306151 [Helianthus anomalus]
MIKIETKLQPRGSSLVHLCLYFVCIRSRCKTMSLLVLYVDQVNHPPSLTWSNSLYMVVRCHVSKDDETSKDCFYPSMSSKDIK